MSFKLQSANSRLFAYFIFLAITGTFLFLCPFSYKGGQWAAPEDALFMAVSAICVTGLSVLDMAVFSRAGMIVLMLLVEAGGLGLVTFFSIYLAMPSKKVSYVDKKLIREFFTDESKINIHRLLFRIVGTTLIIQTVGAILLSVFLYRTGEQNNIFYGVFLSITSFCNAGFAPYSDNLQQFSVNVPVCLTICFLIVAGGIGFTVMADTAGTIKSKMTGSQGKGRKKKKEEGQSRKKRLSLHSRVVLLMTGILVGGGCTFFLITEWNNAFSGLPAGKKIVNALLQSITLRTAGFETVAQSDFTPASYVISLLFMLTGGNPGSMAGGIKTTTLFLVICYSFRSSEDKGEMSLMGRDISQSSVDKAIGILVKAMSLLLIATIALCFSERAALRAGAFSISDLIFETVSAFTTTGLSRGITSELTALSKIILSAAMFAGRTGITAMVLRPGKARKIESLSEFPHEDILVG
ncbi:MAG: hypothetical protein K5930_03215 [Treponemataceae bacterium]|nr:hypothetical protein [Treponemataceae bacterium]